MNNAHPRTILIPVWVACSLLVAAGQVNAQFGPGSYNPYNPTSGGGSYVPGVSNRYVFNIQPQGPISVSVPLGGNVYASWPFYPGQGVITMLSPVANNPNAFAMYPGVWPRGVPFPTQLVYSGALTNTNTTPSGYRTGGAYASSSSGRSMIEAPRPAEKDDNAAGIILAERPAAPVQQPRNAFNRWVKERDRQGQKDQGRFNEEELDRNLTQPELKDVISGHALNVILEALIAMPEKVKKTAPILIEENTLKRLNFTRGAGSIGLLRDEGKIVWPQPLLSLAAIEPLRKEIEARFADAYKQTEERGHADLAALDDLLKLGDQLTNQIETNGKAITFSENVSAKRFLGSLEDSIRFLKQPDAAEWLPGKCKQKPTTVQELVRIMAEKRIRFAPALVGNDNINISTHLMLARLYKQATMNR